MRLDLEERDANVCLCNLLLLFITEVKHTNCRKLKHTRAAILQKATLMHPLLIQITIISVRAQQL